MRFLEMEYFAVPSVWIEDTQECPRIGGVVPIRTAAG